MAAKRALPKGPGPGNSRTRRQHVQARCDMPPAAQMPAMCESREPAEGNRLQETDVADTAGPGHAALRASHGLGLMLRLAACVEVAPYIAAYDLSTRQNSGSG